MKTTPANPYFFPVLVLALVVWAGLLALGAFLGPEFWSHAPKPQATTTVQGQDTVDAKPALVQPFDWRKPIIVAGFMALFLSAWAVALWLRQRRLGRRQQDAQEEGRVADAAVPLPRR